MAEIAVFLVCLVLVSVVLLGVVQFVLVAAVAAFRDVVREVSGPVEVVQPEVESEGLFVSEDGVPPWVFWDGPVDGREGL